MAFLQTDSNGSSNSSINLDGILQNSSSEASFLSSKMERKKTVDEVWRDIMEGKIEEGNRKMIPEFKAESIDEIMTLEDFLLKAGAVDETEIGMEGGVDVDVDVKTENGIGRLSGGVYPMYLGGSGSGISVDGSMGYEDGFELIGGSGNMERGKRRVSMLDGSMDKAAQQRQRRMIKNRESAARSRERKQAYQAELESVAVRLEEENERLLKEKAEKTKERFKQLMQHVIPVAEKRRPARALRRVRSTEL